MSSPAHDLCVARLTQEFTTVMLSQKEKYGDGMENWDLLTNILTAFHDDQGGEYVADITFIANGFTVLLGEILFTQSRPSINTKVDRMLADDHIVGVIVVHIHESSRYRPPSSSDNIFRGYVDHLTWFKKVEKVKNVDVDAFKGIEIFGWEWIKDVTCSVEIIRQADNPPYPVYEVSTRHQFLI